MNIFSRPLTIGQEVIIRKRNVQNHHGFRRGKPDRIALLGTLPPLRGLSSYCLELALSLSVITEIEFISFKALYPALLYPGGRLEEDHTFPLVNNDRLMIKRFLTWYNPVSWFKEGLTNNARLLHVQWWSLPLLPIFFIICLGFKLRAKPVVITVHNVLSHEKTIIYQALSGLLFKLGDHFIVHTAQNRHQLIRHYGIDGHNVSVIPHGILDFYVSPQADAGQIRREMGLESNHKIILLFGAIRPYKGIDTALKAFAKVLTEIPEARLVIAGKLWEDWNAYRKLIDEYGIGKYVSTFLKYIPSDQVHRYFTVADLVVLPYHDFDSQSGVGATAVAFRKPLIVTNVGGLPDLLYDRRFVVPPKNSTFLAKAIIECLGNPTLLRDLASDADILAQKFNWPSIAEQTWNIYTNQLGKTGNL